MWNAALNSMSDSEFKFVCPVCGQHIKCELWRSNSMMECPTCFQRIIVPQAPEGDDVELIIKGSKATRRLVTKPVMNLGTPPAPTPPAKNSTVTIIVLVVLICAAVAATVFMFRGVIFQSAPTETITDNNNVPGAPSNPSPVSPTPTVPVSAGDIALGKPATASSEESGKGNLARNGNDGNTATRWCAANGDVPQWWQMDLRSMTAITNAQIIWERSALYRYVIEVSSNQTNWTVVVDKTTNSVPIQTSSDDFSATGRYVRVVITGLPAGLWASFYEFQVFGSSDSNK